MKTTVVAMHGYGNEMVPALRSGTALAGACRAPGIGPAIPTAPRGGTALLSAPGLLLRAAKLLEPLDASAARATYLDAFALAVLGRSGHAEAGAIELADAVLASPRPEEAPSPRDRLLYGTARQLVHGYAAGVPDLRRSLERFLSQPGSRATSQADPVAPSAATSIELILACRTAINLWDDASWHRLAGRLAATLPGCSGPTDLPRALTQTAGAAMLAGDVAGATTLLEEADTVRVMTGQLDSVQAASAGAVQRGGPDRPVTSDDHRAWSPSAAYAGAVVCNGLGRYEEARHLAGRITLNAPVLGCGLWALPELVEAAVRTSDTPAAGSALARLARTAQASGTDWGLGVAARCRALVSQGATAEEHYQESLDRLTGSRVVVALARSQLLYGEWLRRENRRIEARVQLRTAWELFDGLGAAVFAGRARRELAATGERTRGRSGAGDHLTPQELQIAQLAAAGCSNCEIAERLYLSPRTVEYHLHKAFLRLGIRSRNQLHGLLPPPTVP